MSEDIKENLATASNEQLKCLVEGFKDLIKASPKLQKKIARSGNNEEHGNYYNKNEAEALRGFIDEMMTDLQDRKFLFTDYPYWSPNTVWVKVNQAIKYLVENDVSEEKKYQVFRNRLKICKVEEGILFKILETPVYSGWIAHKLDKESTPETFKDKVFHFMEISEEGEELDLKELSLDEEEVKKLKELLDPSPIFAAFISTSRIKLVHLKAEQIE